MVSRRHPAGVPFVRFWGGIRVTGTFVGYRSRSRIGYRRVPLFPTDGPCVPRRAKSRPSGDVRLIAQALVLAAVVAGTSGFAALHKQLVLEVDGTRTDVSAFGRTVGDVLSAQGIEVEARDVVVPSLDAAVADDALIVVRRARQVEVQVDGVDRQVWTTAQTVGGVVDELGLRADARTSAARSSALGRDMLRVSTPKTVRVAVDGTTQVVLTSGSTVREALSSAGVVLGEHDLVSVPLDTAAVDGLVVMVTRVTTVIATETSTVPFSTVRQDDPTLAKGSEVVSVKGRTGSHTVTFESYRAGGASGVEVGRTVLAESLLAAPVDEVVKVGTKVAPTVPVGPPVEPGTSRAIGLELTLARGWSESEFACLDALFSRESGWRVNASNSSSGAYGIPQALPGSKMASVGADWQTNPATQITWGLNYIAGRYGTPCGAWASFQVKNWY